MGYLFSSADKGSKILRKAAGFPAISCSGRTENLRRESFEAVGLPEGVPIKVLKLSGLPDGVRADDFLPNRPGEAFRCLNLCGGSGWGCDNLFF